MFPLADTKDPQAVKSAVDSIYLGLFPRANPEYIGRVFGWAVCAFEGKYRDYQAIDAKYHDLEHTLQGTLCLAQILRGRIVSGEKPVVTQKMFELGMLAILLHDTGYLKVRGDNEGTGAKYTLIHVSRSADFAKQLLTEKAYSTTDIGMVRRMIRCTGVNLKVEQIPFESEPERVVGYSLGTADLIGQMAADDYIDKLPILFTEFEESAAYSGGKQSKAGLFKDAEDLMRKTPGFWGFYVKPKVEDGFGGQHRFLSDPYPDGASVYLDRIEANISRVKKMFEEPEMATAKSESDKKRVMAE